MSEKQKVVIIDGKKYLFHDEFDCCFNYDCFACHFPGKSAEKCPDYDYDNAKNVFPNDCPLRDYKDEIS